MLTKNLVHIFLHIGFPGIVAFIIFKPKWVVAWIIMLLTMLVDLDHLLANPIYDPDRCSIGFHFLHSYIAIAVYGCLLYFKRTRIIACGLLLHMATDSIDYAWTLL